MQKKVIIGLSIAAVLIIASGLAIASKSWQKVRLEEKPPTVTPPTAITSPQTPTSQTAILQPKNHKVSGEALLIYTGTENILRFENFTTDNGPDLRVYLAADLDAKDFIDLGKLKATEGSINYTIPAGTDLSKYRYAMIWCRAFGVLFSYAEFQ
jgi:hypothetical protein